MPDNITFFVCGYFAAVSLVAIFATIIDKRAAKRGSNRISERSLILVSVFGGSVAMLLIMRLIRHKTKHAKFMVGIPVIIVLQIAAALFVLWRLKGGVL
jgi:uncharacterized membrane protein YsdA (DUF1294 family)